MKASTIKLCGLIYNMISKAKPLTDDLDISAKKIYESVQCNTIKREFVFSDMDNVANYFDKILIPTFVLEVLKQRKEIMTSKKLGDDSRKVISIIAELSDFIDGKNMDIESITEILKKYDYDNIDKNIKSRLDNFLNNHGYDTNGNYHL